MPCTVLDIVESARERVVKSEVKGPSLKEFTTLVPKKKIIEQQESKIK
jgi:hypothetical protein